MIAFCRNKWLQNDREAKESAKLIIKQRQKKKDAEYQRMVEKNREADREVLHAEKVLETKRKRQALQQKKLAKIEEKKQKRGHHKTNQSQLQSPPFFRRRKKRYPKLY